MGGRGASSATVRAKALAALDGQIEQLQGSKSILGKNSLKVAEAAKSMVGTNKPRRLSRSADIKGLERDLAAAYGRSKSMKLLGNIERLESSGFGEQPLALSSEKWRSVKTSAQSRLDSLHSSGYTNEEIAAYINYKNQGLGW